MNSVSSSLPLFDYPIYIAFNILRIVRLFIVYLSVILIYIILS
jgi:hypothetical protein